MWACKFVLYLSGSEYKIWTDHRPLKYIFLSKSKPSAHVELWVLRLQSFVNKVKYIPEPKNIADFLSHLILQQSTALNEKCKEEFEYIKFVATSLTPYSVDNKGNRTSLEKRRRIVEN